MTRIQVNNIPELKQTRRNLRHNLTSAEATLWNHLKKSQVEGRKFRRQHSVGLYVLDFYCPSEKLAVELDGAKHFTPEGEEHDKIRTEYLERFGIRVIRFENKMIFKDLNSVIEGIKSNFANKTEAGGGN
ncbi:MAG: endonuclease domain-containing protein [Bacteroidales bacterium]|nr:endonuclease domain-containing protein [Bacteroidales bacterium]